MISGQSATFILYSFTTMLIRTFTTSYHYFQPVCMHSILYITGATVLMERGKLGNCCLSMLPRSTAFRITCRRKCMNNSPESLEVKQHLFLGCPISNSPRRIVFTYEEMNFLEMLAYPQSGGYIASSSLIASNQFSLITCECLSHLQQNSGFTVIHSFCIRDKNCKIKSIQDLFRRQSCFHVRLLPFFLYQYFLDQQHILFSYPLCKS